jgi:hypothetical protein
LESGVALLEAGLAALEAGGALLEAGVGSQGSCFYFLERMAAIFSSFVENRAF